MSCVIRNKDNEYNLKMIDFNMNKCYIAPDAKKLRKNFQDFLKKMKPTIKRSVEVTLSMKPGCQHYKDDVFKDKYKNNMSYYMNKCVI